MSAEVAINCLGVDMRLLAFHTRNGKYTNSTYKLNVHIYMQKCNVLECTRYAHPTGAVYTVPMIYHSLFQKMDMLGIAQPILTCMLTL